MTSDSAALRHPLHPLRHRRVWSFLAVGGFCTALQYGILVLLVQILGMHAALASTIGYVISSLVNYFLNHTVTFRSTSRHQQSLPRFVLVTLCGTAINGLVTLVGTSVFGWHYLVAQALATVAALIWNYAAHSRWTF
jgi:putative flippase GtrA